MKNLTHQQQLQNDGFTVVDPIYSGEEVQQLLSLIERLDSSKNTFRKSAGLYAIRQFLKEAPEAYKLIFNSRLKILIKEIIGKKCFIIKSIYFDKPVGSNWYVAWHQDLTISVDKKTGMPGYQFWTNKQNHFAVQPPVEILENITTIRIHLDDTDENNGALKVIPASHLKKIYRPETIDWTKETEITCDVQSGGIMFMKPLLLHSSGRTINEKQRRVIHIEFSDHELPDGLNWAEGLALN